MWTEISAICKTSRNGRRITSANGSPIPGETRPGTHRASFFSSVAAIITTFRVLIFKIKLKLKN